MELVGTPEDTEEESGVPDKAVGKATLLSTDILKTNYQHCFIRLFLSQIYTADKEHIARYKPKKRVGLIRISI